MLTIMELVIRMISENEKKVLNALRVQDNWRPNLTKIARDNNMKVTTVDSIIKRFKYSVDIKIDVTIRG
jgi:predicted transcriptional regulator